MKELRNFGLIWSFIFAFIALFPLLSKNDIKIWALYLAIFFLVISLIYPKIFQLTRFYDLWIKFGNFMGKINSKIIIAALFYLLFFPIGLILKISKKDLLNKKIDKSKESYFLDEEEKLANMKNQF